MDNVLMIGGSRDGDKAHGIDHDRPIHEFLAKNHPPMAARMYDSRVKSASTYLKEKYFLDILHSPDKSYYVLRHESIPEGETIRRLIDGYKPLR